DDFLAADWMKHEDVVIESMFATTIARLRVLGAPVRQAVPPEGYRAFGGLFSISSAVTEPSSKPATTSSTGGNRASRRQCSLRRATTTPFRRRAGASSRQVSMRTGSKASPRTGTTPGR